MPGQVPALHCCNASQPLCQNSGRESCGCASPSSGSSAHPGAQSSLLCIHTQHPEPSDRHCPEPPGRERSCQPWHRRGARQRWSGTTESRLYKIIFSSAVHRPLFKHLSTRTRQALTAHSTSNQPLSPALFVLLLPGFNLSPVFCFVLWIFLGPLYTYLLFYKFSCRVFWHIPWIFFWLKNE